MLVLSRKPDEKLLIGGNITIKVLSVRGGVVKLGIDAPPHVRILRGELPNWSGAGAHREAVATSEAVATGEALVV
jgi:carbon storage regulator